MFRRGVSRCCGKLLTPRRRPYSGKMIPRRPCMGHSRRQRRGREGAACFERIKVYHRPRITLPQKSWLFGTTFRKRRGCGERRRSTPLYINTRQPSSTPRIRRTETRTHYSSILTDTHTLTRTQIIQACMNMHTINMHAILNCSIQPKCESVSSFRQPAQSRFYSKSVYCGGSFLFFI